MDKAAIGILGGTFNPIHHGHLRIAEEIAASLQLTQVRFIPSANPPHKISPQVSATHRANMVALAIQENPLFVLDKQELNRQDYSYTIDTLQNLRESLGLTTPLILIMGSDAFSHFDTWHRWQEIMHFCHIALVPRPQNAVAKTATLSKKLEDFLQHHYTENSQDLQNAPAGCISMQTVTSLDISSTVIRQALQNNQSCRYLMPNSVINYAKRNQLYD